MTDPCFEFGVGQTCNNPEDYFFYYIVHPSEAAHKLVGAELYTEVLAIAPVPLPATLPLFGAAVIASVALKRRQRRSAA